MSIPVLTFFNNKGGVGKTSLVYNLSWMFSEMGRRVLACDLDPQANLTAMYLGEDKLESLYEDNAEDSPPRTIFQCVRPLMQVGDLRAATVQEITFDLGLIPGDLRLAGFEDSLSEQWPNSLGSQDLFRPFRILTAFWTIMQQAATEMEASIIVADVGPNLGAINRAALIASDSVVVPLGADLFSVQGLRNLGPTLRSWRTEWKRRFENWADPQFPLPAGRMKPIGYVVQQHSVRLSRPVKAFDRWVNRMPREYAQSLLSDESGSYPATPAEDGHALATLKHYRSLVPMAQEARKPIFELTAADGAIGGHASLVSLARDDFESLAAKILESIENSDRPQPDLVPA